MSGAGAAAGSGGSSGGGGGGGGSRGRAVPAPVLPKDPRHESAGGSDDDEPHSDVGRITASTSEKTLKRICRTGLHPADRGAVWIQLAGASERDDYYASALAKVFGSAAPAPSKVYRVPFLGVEPMALPPSATELMHQPSISLSAAHDRVVCVLAQLHGLRYCPMLSNLGLLLLRNLSETQTFAVLEALLKDNREEWFQKTWEDEVAFVNTFQDILESRHAKLATHLESLGGGTFSFYGSWFRSFFVGWLPSEDTFKIVDCYLSEGPKVLIRFGIAFLRLCLKDLLKCLSDNEVEDALRDFVSMRGFAGKYSFEALSKEAFAIRNLSRKAIYTLYEKHRSLIGDLAEEDEDMMATAYRHPSIWYNPKVLGPASALLLRTFRASSKKKGEEKRSKGEAESESESDSDNDDWDSGGESKEKEKAAKEEAALLDASLTRSVAASPQLSALMSWLPESISLCDWTMVYSSAIHGRGLARLYSAARTVGPTMMLLHTKVRRSSTHLADVDEDGVDGAGKDDVDTEKALGPSASPVFGFFSSRQFCPPSSSRKAGKWTGSLDSFMFQLLPDLTVTGVTTAATAISMAASRIRKDRAADLRSNYSGTVLRADHFLLPTPSFLAIGGNPVTTEVAFRMHEDMEACEMSADLLRDLGVFSLLRVRPDTSAPSLATDTTGGGGEGSAAGAGGASAGAGGADEGEGSDDDDEDDGSGKRKSRKSRKSKKDSDPRPKIPAPEREVVLDILQVELFGFTDRNGNFISDDGATSSAPRHGGTPGKDKDGWF